MKPTCRVELMPMSPILSEEKAVKNCALREMTGSSSFCLISIRSNMYPNKSTAPEG